MRNFQPYTAVVAALRASETLEVSGEEGEEVVKRKSPYKSSSDAQKARLAASVYAKGFGEEEPSTQFDIEAYFAKFGQVNLVKLRRTPDNKFKGSVFVEFHTEELANNFVKQDPAPTWKGEPLKVMKKLDYLEEKNRMIKAGEIEPSTSRRQIFFEGNVKGTRGGRGRGRGNRENGNTRDWKERRDEDRKNGFKSSRGGRGGRGRGRGGRGGHSRDRDQNARDSDKVLKAPDVVPVKSTNEYVPSHPNECAFLIIYHSVQRPMIQSTSEKGKAETNGKRAREDDSAQGPPAKKADTKTEAVAAQ